MSKHRQNMNIVQATVDTQLSWPVSVTAASLPVNSLSLSLVCPSMDKIYEDTHS